jgi:hypothetical protein
MDVNGQQSAHGAVHATLPSGQAVEVRVEQAGDGLGSVGRDRRFDLREALAPVGEVAALVRERLEPLKPAKTTVEFGVSFSVGSGGLTALVFEGKGEASLSVTLEWEAQATARA